VEENAPSARSEAPELSLFSHLHAVDPQYAKDLNYNYNSRKTKNNF